MSESAHQRTEHNTDKSAYRAGSELRQTLLAAFVGALVAVIISPISLVLSFYLGNYLSRPLLSIEYTEVIQETKPIPIPTKLISDVVQSTLFVNYLMVDRTLMSLMATANQTEVTSIEEFVDLKGQIQSWHDFLVDKAEQIKELKSQLVSTDNPDLIVSMAESLKSDIPNFYPDTGLELERLKASLLARLDSELSAIPIGVKQAAAALNAFQGPTAEASDLLFKVSILNRGETSGLVRSTGQIYLGSGEMSFPIVRIEPPKPKSASMMGMSVPVTVTNPPESDIRESSVGKIEQNSMSEFWYQVHSERLDQDRVQELASALGPAPGVSFRIVLIDHEDSDLSYSAPSFSE